MLEMSKDFREKIWHRANFPKSFKTSISNIIKLIVYSQSIGTEISKPESSSFKFVCSVVHTYFNGFCDYYVLTEDRSSHQSCSRKTPVLESLLNKVARLQACNFIKNRLQSRCFYVNIAKFLRTPILNSICKWLLLWRTGTGS